jgi:hypothetical protein
LIQKRAESIRLDAIEPVAGGSGIGDCLERVVPADQTAKI